MHVARVRAAISAFAVASPILFGTATAYAVEPTTTECLDASEGSIARRKEHKLREARAQALVCAASSCPGEVREECSRRVTQIGAEVPSLILIAKSASGADIVDATVTIDGRPFATRLDGNAVELDPGEHLFTFEAAGAARVEQRIVIREGEKRRRETVVLGAPVAVPAPPPVVPTAQASDSPPPPAEASPASADTDSPNAALKYGGLAVAGVGVAALVVGAALGMSARSTSDEAGCQKNLCPSEAASAKMRDAIGSANIATGFFVGGGVFLGAGLLMFFLAPSAGRSSPSRSTARLGVDVTSAGGAVNLAGSW